MEDGLNALVQMFEEAEESTQASRKLSERDRDYYDGKQWTDEETRALNDRKQPVVTYNRIQRKIDFLSGLEKQQRKDPKAFPRTPKDQDAADAATDALRYVCDDSKWDEVRSEAWDDLLIEGTCAVFVGHKESRNGIDPTVTRIAWDRFWADPASAKPDFSDARYMGVVTWYDVSEAERKWPERKEVISSTLAAERDSDTYDDKPKHSLWADARRKRVRVIEAYNQEGGQWKRCVFTRAGELEDSAPSPYVDEDGKPENPIKAMSLYVDRDNNRYGSVRVMISPQDEVNKRRSKGLHLLTMRQVRVSRNSDMDAEDVRKQAAKPDGIFTGEKEDFDFLDHNDMAQGNLNMLQEAKNEIDLLGANSALSGKNENDMSGRAILAQQQGGMTEVARMFDRLRSLSLNVYRGLWNRTRQMWTNERWIRITDDDSNLRFVGLNQQVTVKMIAEGVTKQEPQDIEAAAKLVGPEMLQAYMQGDEQAQMMLGMFVQQNGDQVVETRNAINELDVDIVLDEGMDTPTIQSEQFDSLMKMVPGMFPQGMPPPVLEMLVQASQLRDKDKLIEIIQQMGQQPPDPAEEQMKQIAMAGAVAGVRKTESEATKNEAQAANAGNAPTDPIEHQFRAAEIETEQFDAVTARMQALQPDRAAA